MRTACFVDGYNVYYGLVHGTAFKWLNLPALIEKILRIQLPQNELVNVFYFTSLVLPTLASNGTLSHEAQQAYIRALKHAGVDVVLGKHRLDKGKAPAFIEGVAASRQHQVDIWSLEEKQTDVNLALSLYRFALQQARLPVEDRVTQLVLFSNDSDFEPALAAIRADFPEITVGVISPIREGIRRAPSGSLKKHAHWMRSEVKNDELSSSIFPDRILTRKKPIFKPNYW
ncbi:TPA: NYN domain-containing protein [Aeromonas dhakensis]|uniref:NYN domain-containing protein n=1 Tax=Aeromonas TaxID=642 RepID=UPI002890A8AA|nr:NYN domain-containing protein [Aeromonas dhakensis]HDX8487701.1 NYN domain-containing protein [Aeromonas dhakensis]HDX8514656.1 NYN domain-containing protein [Aeromonas dhakensis]HDZ8906984.1 NYN domain-containing protein [Aeromonas dhakensis]HDZ9334606.1 NYN domain-containing protein [Aeromonas dhakensis]